MQNLIQFFNICFLTHLQFPQLLQNENCLVRLVFYDRYELEAGSITLRDKTTEFQCPLKTYSYRMQLINGGVTKFHFHSVVIEEIVDESESRY